MIDARAVVAPEAKIAPDVEIGPFSVIGRDVEIGPGTWIGPHVVIKGPTRIGAHNPKIKALFTSASPIDAAGDRFLAKPYGPSELLRHVRAALDVVQP